MNNQSIRQIIRKCRICKFEMKVSDESNVIFCSLDCLMVANSQLAERGHGDKLFEVSPKW